MFIFALVVNYLALGVVCFAFMHCISHVLKKVEAATLHRLWLATFLFSAITPLWGFIIPGRAILSIPQINSSGVPVTGIPVQAAFSNFVSLSLGALVSCYFIGVIYQIFKIIAGYIYVGRMFKMSTMPGGNLLRGIDSILRGDTGTSESISIRISREVNSPVTGGLGRKFILLPIDAKYWSLDLVTMVLTHEMEHIRRKDVLWNLVCQVISVTQWPNPLVWRGFREVLSCQELACDKAVMKKAKATEYVKALFTISGKGFLPSTLVPLAGNGYLKERVYEILKPSLVKMNLSLARGLVLSLLVMAVMLVVPFFSVLKLEASVASPDTEKNQRIEPGPGDLRSEIQRMREQGMSRKQIEIYFISKRNKGSQ